MTKTRLFLTLAFSFSAAACDPAADADADGPDGPEPVAEEVLVESGSYRLYDVWADDAPADGLSGVTIDVDTEELTATLHLADGSQPSLTLTALPKDEWIEDCWTSDSYTLAQAFAISPDPVVIGALTIESPVLTTKCGGNLMLQSDDVIIGFE